MKSLFAIALLTMVLLILTSCQQKDFMLMSDAEIDSMSMEEKLAAIDEEVKKNPPREMTQEERSVENEVMDFMTDGNVLKSGNFEGRAHPTSGTIQIIEKNGETLVMLSDDFKSDAGPELHVILTEHDNPKNSRELHTGEYEDLGILKSTKGAQTYVVPKDKAGKLKTATIYCKPFKVIFGAAALN
jgi:hypothetical protein